MDVQVDGVSTPLLVNSLSIDSAVGQRSTASVTLVDSDGSQHYDEGQRVDIYDDASTLIYSGYIDSDDEEMPDPAIASGLLYHHLSLKDGHYLADKRLVATSYASGQTCKQVIDDLVTNYLASEGVVTYRGINLSSAIQSDYEAPLDLTEWGGDAYTPNCGAAGGISRDTTQGWHGRSSLKVVMDGSATFQSLGINIPASKFTAGATYTFSAYMKAHAGQSPNLRFFIEGNDLIAGNHAISATTLHATPTSSGWTRYSVTAAMPNPIVDSYIGLRLDDGGTAQAVTFWLDGLQIEQAGSASAWEPGSSMASIATGVTLPDVVFNYATVAACLDALAQKAGAYWWQIDANKALWFQPYAAIAAPWALTSSGPVVTDARNGSVKVKRAKPMYRNRQYLRIPAGLTSSQTETRKGDGIARTFVFGYQLAKVPTVTVNGVGKTVGIKQLDTGKDWYWSAGDNTLTQDNGGTLLTSSDTLQVVYIGSFPAIIISEDTAQVVAQQTLEGGGTTGYVEDIAEDASLSTTDAAFQEASALLAKYAQKATTLTFTTRRSGLEPGQLLTVTIPRHNLTSAQMLIESVRMSDQDGQIIWYDVTALLGPVNTTWVQFFGQLVQSAQTTSESLSVGASSALVIAQPFTGTWTWTESVTPTAYACPIFPATFPLTLC